ncbi:MAG: saccharopine dehydrogenase, partial [Pseudomonadota bacterium]
AAMKDPEVERRLKDPYSLVPGYTGVDQPPGHKPRLDEALGSWVTPFVMAPINTRNVFRTNALLGHPYGEEFRYDEMVFTGPGEKGEKLAYAMAERSGDMASDKAPKPGEGPDKAEREAGHYDILFVAETDAGMMSLAVTGDRDPGYGSTSKMLAEAALCLVKDKADTPGGILTPAAAMGQALIDRLVANAGLTFDLE